MHVETEFSDELVERIVAYVEREEGRDAPLSPEDEAMVRDLLATSPAAQVLANDLRSTNTRLGELLDVSADVEVPEHLVTMIRAHGALTAEREGGRATGQVLPFRPASASAKSARSYGPLAAAASIALLVSGGGLLYQSEMFDQERQRLQAEQTGLEGRLAELVDKNGALQLQVEEASQQVAMVESERDVLSTELESAMAAAEDAVAGADAHREALLADVADLNSQLTTKQQEVDSLSADLSSAARQARAAALSLEQLHDDHQAMETRVVDLGADNRALKERLNAVEETLASVEQQNTTLLAEATEAENLLSALRAQGEAARSQFELERIALEETLGARERELADVRTALAKSDKQASDVAAERDRIAARLGQDGDRIVALENDLNDAAGELAALRSNHDRLQAEAEQLREDSSWLSQVVGYHRLYAGTPHEVEMSAAAEHEKQALTKWLELMLGRNFAVPDLSATGLTFIGGRVFAVKGMPTGQIAYHDRQGRLAGFCFTQSPEGGESAPTLSQDGDLNLVSWRKNGIDYVLVGWAAPAELGLIGTQLQRNYGDDI